MRRLAGVTRNAAAALGLKDRGVLAAGQARRLCAVGLAKPCGTEPMRWETTDAFTNRIQGASGMSQSAFLACEQGSSTAVGQHATRRHRYSGSSCARCMCHGRCMWKTPIGIWHRLYNFLGELGASVILPTNFALCYRPQSPAGRCTHVPRGLQYRVVPYALLYW
jgi:hypothetical protein